MTSRYVIEVLTRRIEEIHYELNMMFDHDQLDEPTINSLWEELSELADEKDRQEELLRKEHFQTIHQYHIDNGEEDIY